MYFVFSDVHGCYGEMKEVLKQWDRKKETLIFLGDMIDRGEESYQVIRELMNLKNKYGSKVVVLKGNHEDMFMNWLYSPSCERALNYYNGLHETLKSFYLINPQKFKKDTRRQRGDYVKKHHSDMVSFINSLPTYYESEHCVFVHAGFNLEDPDWRMNTEAHLWIREGFYFSETIHDKRVFFGHTPTSYLHHSENEHSSWQSYHGDKIGIDGGCVSGGQLNALRLNEFGEITEEIFIEKSNIKREKIVQ
ncbi:serine/threonine protein phosphatase [Halobacillus locisalis]|uniref:Serine/threonine protein phosphatase n=1 Tax=Halobacillus locisalis TaxID=220753 RepID=A0A838CYC2_9BACI|nr:metallophosphoesterase family protein [Halobacillus locisalis]MBA2176878.1 serine/threonine protein phosphatase [Halobacillus locisalis]